MPELNLKQLRSLAARMKNEYVLFGSVWGKAEIEVMAFQTIKASVVNLRTHGKPFSFNTVAESGGGYNNVVALQKMVDLNLIAEGEFLGRKTLIPTQHLLDTVEVQLDNGKRMEIF